jgi:hypothetical protein
MRPLSWLPAVSIISFTSLPPPALLAHPLQKKPLPLLHADLAQVRREGVQRVAQQQHRRAVHHRARALGIAAGREGDAAPGLARSRAHAPAQGRSILQGSAAAAAAAAAAVLMRLHLSLRPRVWPSQPASPPPAPGSWESAALRGRELLHHRARHQLAPVRLRQGLFKDGVHGVCVVHLPDGVAFGRAGWGRGRASGPACCR